MRVFGCLVYVKENKQGRDKFEERGRPYVFIGYPQRQKGYKVFDIQENKIIVSRDVKFVECKFPYQEQTSNKNVKETKTIQPIQEDVFDQAKTNAQTWTVNIAEEESWSTPDDPNQQPMSTFVGSESVPAEAESNNGQTLNSRGSQRPDRVRTKP